MAGAPSQQSATQFGTQMKNSRTLPYSIGAYAQGVDLQDTLRLNSNLYPTRFVPSDDYDTEWMIRQQIAEDGSGMISQKRPMPWTEKEIDYLKRKRDAEEYAAYNTWLIQKFPLNDPANRDILKRTVPRYFEERKAVLSEQINLSAKYANLRLFGPENEDDLKLQYAVETGRVKLPQGPFHDPMQWTMNEIYAESGMRPVDNLEFSANIAVQNQKTYNKGLFNPFSFLTWANAPWGPNARNMADSVGDNRAKNLGPYGVHNPTNESYNRQYSGADLGQTQRLNDWVAHDNDIIAARRTSNAANPGVGRVPEYMRFNANLVNRTPWDNTTRRFG